MGRLIASTTIALAAPPVTVRVTYDWARPLVHRWPRWRCDAHANLTYAIDR